MYCGCKGTKKCLELYVSRGEFILIQENHAILVTGSAELRSAASARSWSSS